MNYSIIIPHHNSPQLLIRCLDSIPKREDLEIIVVDDNSDSDIVDFAHFPGYDRDDVQLIFTKEGKGAGYARNVGLDHAKGKWLIFFDADDFALPKFNAILDKEIESTADLIYYCPKSVKSHDINIGSARGKTFWNIIEDYSNNGDESSLRTGWLVVWSVLIRRSMVEAHNIRCDEIRYSNDNYFSIKMGCVAKAIEVRNDSFYVVTERENSLASSFLKKEGELECRAKAYLRSSQVIAESPYKVNHKALCSFAYKLYFSHNELYNQYAAFLRDTCGYSSFRVYWMGFGMNYFYKSYCNMITNFRRIFG